ncbi:MAG: ABC transporter ATP-binding protein/permease [Alphaproteobacteria bacterium]|nr:ABC transporter ATP-binding protein/permease [Alphaproteobacteria bacterium]
MKTKGFLSLFAFLGKYKKYACLSPLFVIGEVACEIVIPVILGKILDESMKNGFSSYVKESGILLVILCLIALVLGSLAGRCSAVAGAGFAKNLRLKCFSKVQDFSFGNIDKISVPSIITRLTSDVTMVQNVFILLIRSLIRSPMMIVGSIIMALKINVELAYIFLAIVPVYGFCMFYLSKIANPLFLKLMEKYDGLNSALQEILIAIRVVKSFSREDFENKKFERTVLDLKSAQVKAEGAMTLSEPLMYFCLQACLLLVLFFGGKMVLNETLTPGELICFITYISNILLAMGMLSMLLIAFFRTKVCAKRINDVLDEEILIKENKNSNLTMKDNSIEFENVNFGFVNDRCVLKNLNFKINSGETIGILGQTGSGKSALVMLIPRLYDILSGKIKIGGNDIKDYSLRYLRSNVSMVLQNNTLFSGTVEENLRWGNINASKEEINKVCEIACVNEFISKMPNGLDTELGEGGVNLSGGQKQRLCIARALLKKPKIIIFDDSTSAVDTATDRKIRSGLKDYMPDTTKIIIAQRIISVMNADRIILVKNGEIVAFDTPDNLLNSNELYSDIYKTQMGGING